MPLINRDLVITWGTYVISTANKRLITGWTYNEDSYETASAQFEFVVTGTDDASFASECNLAEAAFRKPRQTLTIQQGSAVLLSLSHASNTGFDSIPTIIKSGQVGDTGRSRFYRVHIAFGRPADNVGTSGRRTGSIDVSYTPSRQRIVTFSGVYTALATTARAQYAASIDAYCTGVLASLGIVQYDLLEEPITDENDTNKVINFKRIYREIIYPQAGSPNDPAIIGDSLSIEVSRDGNEDGSGEEGMPYHLASISVNYDCSIDKNVTQDLESKYKTIKSSIMDKIRSGLGVSTIGIIEESPSYDYTANRISAKLVVAGVVAGTLIHYRISTKTTNELGKIFVPAWTGDALSYYEFQGPARSLRTTIRYRRTLGGGQAGMAGSAGGGQNTAGGSNNIVVGRLSGIGNGGTVNGVFAGGLFGNNFLTGQIFSQGDAESSTGLFSQPNLPTDLGGGSSGAGADAGPNAAGGAGGGAGTVTQSLDPHAGATTPQAAIAEPVWREIYNDYEAIPLFVGLPDGDVINFLDTIDTKIEQCIKPIQSATASRPVTYSQAAH
jgi:hypothetical protein